ncbi:MAG: (deoxy)nucleoside triphosphate pyrophosphohydrolase [Candidatus Aminicenantes bacterium]|nr:(deoxy)nucleoside triphosphate pyrophosphohydrolase [Candidatus Aminicenantes bacterium]
MTITDSFYSVSSVIFMSMIDRHKSENLEMPLLVTAAIIFNGDRVLITRRPNNKAHAGLWEFPGGKVDPGESPEEALYREIREELDVEIQVAGVFEVAFYRYDWGSVLILAYNCQLLTNDLRNIEVAEHRWVHPRNLADFPILPADQPIIDRLNNQSDHICPPARVI